MKRKRLANSEQNFDQISLEDNEESSQTMVTTQYSNISSISGSANSQPINPIANVNNSVTTNPDINTSTQTSLIKEDIAKQSLTSKVWLYAKKSDDGKQASCTLCKFVCSCNSHSTSTIRQHLITKHNRTDLIINLSTSNEIIIPIALKKELHQLCYYAIIKDSRSFNDLNKVGIKCLINKLCPGYSPPHRNQVSKQLENLYNHHYQLLKNELKTVYRLGITLDFWSNRNSESFLCITGHWFTNDIDPVSKIIDFSCFNSRHTGKDIAQTIKEKLMALDIYEKVISITCDGAENMVLACFYLQEDMIRIWCCAHRLHLVVINALGFWLPQEKIDAFLNNSTLTTTNASPVTTVTINNSIITNNSITKTSININVDTAGLISGQSDVELSGNSSIFNDKLVLNNGNTSTINNNDSTIDNDEDAGNDSSSDEDVDDEEGTGGLIFDSWSVNFDIDVHPNEQQIIIIELIKKCRAIAKMKKKVSMISQFFRSEQATFKLNKTIRIDCKSRWNSTYTLIDSVIELKNVIIKLFNDKRSLKLQRDQIQKLTTIELNSENWYLLSSLHDALEAFYWATTLISGKNYPSIGICYYAIQKIRYFCSSEKNSDDQLKKLKKMLLEKLNYYFNNDYEQLQHLQRHAYFDPVAHLVLTEREKFGIEQYVKNLIMDDIYPLELSSNNTSTTTSTDTSSSSTANTTQLNSQISTSTKPKPSVFQSFLRACGEEEATTIESAREKSKRIMINEELKYFKSAVHAFNADVEPSTSSAIKFWKMHKDRLPLLTHLAKIHLSTCATSVPSESAFSISSYIARKERSRLSSKNLGFSVFLKDKVLIDN